MHVCLCVRVCVHIYVHIHIYIYTGMSVCMCECIFLHTSCAHVYYARVHINVVSMCTCARECVRTYMHICMYAHVCMCIYTCIVRVHVY